MAFAIKAEMADRQARTFTFARHKTMYGGKRITKGDAVFLFAGAGEAARGLIASGVVVSADLIARTPGIARQTPRVSVTVGHLTRPVRSLEHRALKPFTDWEDGRAETELNFKLYRQATDKIVGITGDTAAFLEEFFTVAGPEARRQDRFSSR